VSFRGILLGIAGVTAPFGHHNNAIDLVVGGDFNNVSTADGVEICEINSQITQVFNASDPVQLFADSFDSMNFVVA
jgi:hypothetical protein